MWLIVTEKNQTAKRIASILSEGKMKVEGDKAMPVYSFALDGEQVKCVGVRGHVLRVDFPEEYRRWESIEPKELLGADIVKVPTEKAVVTKLKRLAKTADRVIIATDYDREGELIGYDISSLIKEVNPNASFARARFSALTESQIREAFENPSELMESLAKAGEARQDIDLLWGAALTRFISLASRRLGQRFLSVGRVQSPTLALIVEREKEISEFVPEDYWTVTALLETSGKKFSAQHKKGRFSSEKEALASFSNIRASAKVTSVTQKERLLKPPSPFNTTSFLSAASSAFKMSSAKAMDIAESLYSRGYISYPRVDNTVYPDSLDLRGVCEAISKASVVGELADELLEKPKFSPTRGKKFSTDHPPIYPTGSADKGELTSSEWKIYELVVRRFFATLAGPAKVLSTTVDFESGGEPLRAKGQVVVEEGYLHYYPYTRRKDEELPSCEKGMTVAVVDKKMEAKQTQPPPRYSEGKLIEKMEELGLGTKATRHAIIQNLRERGYILSDPVKPTSMGGAVADALTKNATLVATPDMTAQLERDMDDVVKGKVSLEGVVGESKEVLAEILDQLSARREQIGEEIRAGVRGDLCLGTCPSCGGELSIKRARASGKRFVGCSNYPKCKVAFPLPQKGGILATGEICPLCGTPKIKVIKSGSRPWELCLDPDCESKKKQESSVASGGKKGAGKSA